MFEASFPPMTPIKRGRKVSVAPRSASKPSASTIVDGLNADQESVSDAVATAQVVEQLEETEKEEETVVAATTTSTMVAVAEPVHSDLAGLAFEVAAGKAEGYFLWNV